LGVELQGSDTTIDKKRGVESRSIRRGKTKRGYYLLKRAMDQKKEKKRIHPSHFASYHIGRRESNGLNKIQNPKGSKKKGEC